MTNIITERLYLVPFTLEKVTAAITGNSELSRVLGVKILPDWAEEEFIQNLPEIANILSKFALQGQWGWGNLIIQQAENTLIGHVMIKIIPDATGSPTDSVELGYYIMPLYRQQGYASEATKAMVDWTLCQPGMAKVKAGCDADNLGSKRVLEKIGMRQIETRGKTLVWELSKTEIIE
jgi:[ribosomal protein S5]-alanine N-acetyltransferase